MPKIKIILADDSQNLLNILKRIIETDDDLEVVALCHDGKDALDLTLLHSPDVLVLDISMPVIDGFEVIRLLRLSSSLTKIIVLSGHSYEFYGNKAIESGADLYIEKGLSVKSIISDIKSVYNG